MIRFAMACLAALWACAASAQEQRDVKAYVFGNSLFNHVGDMPHTNVAHWLDQLATAGGRGFALDGQWGFLRDFARMLPPTANWGFPGVAGVWNPDAGGFGQAPFTDILITPANFIQYQPATAPYDGENDGGATPVSATLRVLDWITAQGMRPRFHIYEGWSDMGGVAGAFPPDAEGLARYHAFNGSGYHIWYNAYVQTLRQERPDLDIRLIPVASVLSRVLAAQPLDGLPATAFYTDDAPHGTPTLYFLAAMVSHTALYGAPPPAGFTPPGDIHPTVAAAYPQIAETIGALVRREAARLSPPPAATAEPMQRTAQTTTEPEEESVAEAPAPTAPPLPRAIPRAEADATPALAMGLNGIADWSTQHPFIDVMKSAREWIGHLPDQWGGVTADDLRAGGHLDDNGWLLSLPPEVTHVEALILTDQPEEAEHLRGTYLVLYDGQGDLKLTGRARRVIYEPGEIRFAYAPGEGLVALSIGSVDPDDPIRNIRVLREDHLPLYEAGAIFNPDWIARVQDVRAVRFMDWMFTNGSPLSGWDSRPRMDDYTWTSFGVPLPVMVALANRIGADPWFTLPHLADDDFARRFATIVRDTLDPRLKAYVEYSNEMWNFIFPQAHWASAQAEARWGQSQTGWMQFYALRAAQVMDIWTEVFGAEADDRLVRVVATHTGWPGLEEDILIAPLAFLELGRLPRDSFDAYAVTGYFGYELGGEEMAAEVQGWLDTAEAEARAAGEAQGLRRVALREYIRERRFDAAFQPVTEELLDGSLRELVQELFPYHAAAAEEAGLQLIMYEGGTHATPQGERVDDERLSDFFVAYNYSSDMAALYEVLLTGWVQAGGTLFNAFVDVAPATRWGSWGALRHLSDDNPRWDVLMDYNRTAPSDWEDRDPAAFANGIFLSGDGLLEGTPEEDILLGGPGADEFVSNGGADRLNGGPGEDLARLRGPLARYSFRREDGRLIADGPFGSVTMIGIERLRFDSPIETVFPADSF
ncbi:calcium-binding protein [Aestuariicoccus sp. MJ-SS9]|uniref:calcium-binding protein n=1 Tax=Aestuariicoccus sp. MJ-SS9 TaxID=3079855 RepID=UPI00290B2EFC|nr:calcium-binding protein [Aestuariicoccus sp. MJ-SS9]MDU8910806.1 calcium-binding protein [Aestuariicoccus sp. MJ-SS9]